MHTLEQLESGQLSGISRLQLSENLTHFPKAIFSLANSLEILELSNNQLSDLPSNFSQLTQLKILFLTNNNFDHIPKVLAACPKLEMISFKSNKLTNVDEDVLPINTRWLILTDNKIASLPSSFGQLHRLKKLALAGNKLTTLPSSMASCKALELIRLSANQLTTLPNWLFELPKLAWLAFSGNPLEQDTKIEQNINPIPSISSNDYTLKQQLGQGASGIIHQASWNNQSSQREFSPNDIAVKVFKGAITSDGYPLDELNNCLQAGEHPNLIKALAKIMTKGELALIMELIPSDFYNLGLPPSLITCTRDTFSEETRFSLTTIIEVITQLSDAMSHMHSNQISHGDLYAHNTMINEHDEVLFGDFGAASNLKVLTEKQRLLMEKIEVRALGYLLDDLLVHFENQQSSKSFLQIDSYRLLQEVKENCLTLDLFERTTFDEVKRLIG